MSGLLDWIKEEPAAKPSHHAFLLVKVNDFRDIATVRNTLHKEVGGLISDVPLRPDGYSWPYITGNPEKAKAFYTTLEGIFDAISAYAKRQRTRQRDFVRAGAR